MEPTGEIPVLPNEKAAADERGAVSAADSGWERSEKDREQPHDRER